MKTTKMAVAVMAAVMIVAGSVMAVDAEITFSVDVASAYVFRGVTFNDGPVLQPGMEAEIGDFVIGVWGNIDLDDYDGTLEKGQFSEIDVYAAYALPVEFMDIAIEYCEYTFPGAEGKAEREVALVFGLDVPLSPELLVAYGVDGGIKKDLYLELGVGYEMDVADMFSVELGAAIGYLIPDEGDSGFSAYSLTAGAAKGPFYASVTYVGQIDDDVLTDEAYDVEVYGLLGMAFTF